jgi:hypothetical protein
MYKRTPSLRTCVIRAANGEILIGEYGPKGSPALKSSDGVTSLSRKFTIFDLAILAAATMAGFGIFHVLGISDAIRGQSYGTNWQSGVIDRAILHVVPFLIGWTLAFPLIRLRKPRPRIRKLFRQPGMAGCTAGSIAILYELIWMAFIPIRYYVAGAIMAGFLPTASGFLRLCGDLVCVWLAAAWMVLLLGGRWRAERGWVDRLGRILCLAWIVVRVLEAAFYHVA